jgi:hypothetical protein
MGLQKSLFGLVAGMILVVSLVWGLPGIQETLAQPAAPAAMTVWTEHIAHKVQPTTAVGLGSSIILEGARRSYEAAQIVVRASGSALSDVSMTSGDLSDGVGHTIAASNVTFFRQAFIDFTGVSEAEPGNEPVPENSPTGDPLIPDPLIPFTDPYTTTTRWVGAPFGVATDRNQPVWVDFYIPESTVAGTYTGAITVTAAGQPDAVVPVTLVVWDLVLPDMRVVTPYFRLSSEQVTYYHRDTYDCSGTSCWLNHGPQARLVVKRYEELAHTHRIDPGQTFIPVPGGCAPPTDWDEYDAALQPYMDGSYWSDGIPSTRTGTRFTPGADWGIQTSCTDEAYTGLAQAWAAHLEAKGWLTRTVVYALDEPPSSRYDEILHDALLMQAGDPDWKTQIMDTTSARPSTDVLTPALGIFCECLRCYDHWWQNQENYGRAEWPALFAQGIDLWFYESNAQSDPFPTFATNTLLGVEPRIIMWGSWYEYASGFLLWDTVAWDRNDYGPWGPNVDYGKSGDGVLIYPGHHDGRDAPDGSPPDVEIDGPVPSYRLKVIRQGLQDWALFKLADQEGYTDYARSEVERVYGQFGGCDWSGCPPPVNGEFYWLTDADLMDEVRHNIAMVMLGILNVAPNVPHSPNPADGAVAVPTGKTLTWQGGDLDRDPVTYTVAFGTTSSPSGVVTVTQMLYAPSLITGTTYFWQITATDGISTTVGPEWQFTTAIGEVYLPLTLRAYGVVGDQGTLLFSESRSEVMFDSPLKGRNRYLSK